MSVVLWCLAVSVAAVAGFAFGVSMGREERDIDERTIGSLRLALKDTQKSLGEMIAVKDEAVAAQERSDAGWFRSVEALVAAQEELAAIRTTRSAAGRKAWQTRKLAQVRDEVADVT